ncbi:hypothetical protein RSOLAG22IIIB_10974 [Rhizoctonia solani]|uniref:Uncharacterized protein n=1 Tax=Rhizoctonia solani TaxID=456999 RepID=A0A0K6G6W2_9AGAM|nr:hypothetical protein RSOLAG22IIIB_10974 [Rhizoctonia solani]
MDLTNHSAQGPTQQQGIATSHSGSCVSFFRLPPCTQPAPCCPTVFAPSSNRFHSFDLPLSLNHLPLGRLLLSLVSSFPPYHSFAQPIPALSAIPPTLPAKPPTKPIDA